MKLTFTPFLADGRTALDLSAHLFNMRLTESTVCVCVCVCMCVCVCLVVQSCLTLCNPMDVARQSPLSMELNSPGKTTGMS